MIAALVLAVLFVLSLMGNFQQFVGSVAGGPGLNRHAGLGLQKVTLEHNHSRNNIAVVDVTGIISGDLLTRGGDSLVSVIADQLESAGEDPSIKAVVLKVDSPGGEVLASDDIAREIASFQNEHKKPVVASLGSVAASGGYYVSAPCRWIVANELTITGSIGVIMHGYNYRGLMDKVGVHPMVFKSGKFKDMLSGDRPVEEILPEERKMMQQLIDETYSRFKQVVSEGRNSDSRKSAVARNGLEVRRLGESWAEYADGRVLSGRQAYDLGFVDELGNFDTAVEAAQTLAGIKDANLVGYQRPFDLGNLFRIFGQSEGRSLKIDLGLQIPKLQSGRLYFLSPTMLP